MKIKRWVSVVLTATFLFGCIPFYANAVSNEQTVYEYLVKNLTEMNSAAICGMMAGIESESNFNPTAKYAEADGSESFGICQWNGGRRTSLETYCSDNGLDYTTLNAQLKYLEYELTKTSEKTAYQLICSVADNQNGAYKAGYYCAKYYERCAEAYHTRRAELARDKYWPKYGTSTPEPDIEYSEIECGINYYIKNVSTGKYLSVDSESDEKKVNISVAAVSDSSTMRFVMNSESEGYCIKPEFTETTVVNIYGTVVKSGCNVCLWTRTGDTSQHFNFEKSGDYFIIRNVQNKNCVLDVSGTNVLVNTYSQSASSQKWILIPDKTPEKPCVVAQATTDSEKTVVEWSTVKYADKYTVTLKNLTTGATSVIVSETSSTSCETVLKAGNYSVTVTALNTKLPVNFETKGKNTSDPCTFTVSETHIHSFTGKTEYATPPTCTAGGILRIYCSDETCGEFTEQNVGALNHLYNSTPVETLPPTCTEYGTVRIYCSREKCDNYIEIDVEPTGHSFDGKTEYSALPTCTESGVLRTYCSNGECEEFTETPIEPLGHSYEGTVYPPTYGSKGYTRHVCTACGDFFDDEFVDALDVFYGDANADGVVNMKDVLLIRKIVAGIAENGTFDEERADANASGSVNIADVLLVRKYVAGIIGVFPPDEK